jgi:3-deoxy-D-manno-octulosonic-acid transferase
VQLEGCIFIKNPEELQDAFDQLLANADIRHEKGHICGTFVQMNKGATEVILRHLSSHH